MKITLARRIGFCFGVKRAVAMAEEALRKERPIYSLGSIIHNKQVVDVLSKKGLKVIKDIAGIRGGAIVISSHGISPKIAGDISKKGIRIIDTTCPFVLNAQKTAKQLSDGGYTVIIVGDSDHPEVKALVDHARKIAHVVKDKLEADALKLKAGGRISVISQTTQDPANFLNVVSVILKKRPKEARIFNTICEDAKERQGHARRLAAMVDLMLVVGGKDSANTRRLLEVSRTVLKNSHLVETEADLQDRWFKRVKKVGVTSGASTPDWVVKRVVDKIKSIKKGVA